MAFVRDTGSISQTVTFSAGSYTLDFEAAQRGNYNFGGQTLEVLVDGTAVPGYIVPVGSNYALYTSAIFTVTAGAHTITIAGLDPSGGDNTALVDGVSLAPSVNQIADGSFETDAVGSSVWLYAPSDSSWTFTGTAGVTGNGGAIAGGNPDAPQGNQAAFIQQSGSISQEVSFSAGTYTVSFLAAQRGNYNFGGQTLEVLVDGVPEGQFTPTSATYQGYTSVSFTVSTGMHEITIQGLNPQGGDNTALIDQVMLNMVSA